ncbi:MAG: hypothetical protein AMXMBFR64_43270 [Myxococcales bacterium]
MTAPYRWLLAAWVAAPLAFAACDDAPPPPTFDPSDAKTSFEGDPKSVLKLYVAKSTPAADGDGRIDMGDNESLKVVVNVESNDKNLNLNDFGVVWCDQYSVPDGEAIQRLCPDLCGMKGVGGDGARTAELYLPPGALSTLGKEKLEHRVLARLYASDELANPDVCKTAPLLEDSVVITLRTVIKGPAVTVMPAPADTKCYTTSDRLKVRIEPLKAYPKATYEITWYKSIPFDSDQVSRRDLVQAGPLWVCEGTEEVLDSPCLLPPSSTKKGDTFYVTARLVSDGSGNAFSGAETQDPPAIQVCDSYPSCSAPKVSNDPVGVSGAVRCLMETCTDADSDPVLADLVITNLSLETGAARELKGVGPFNLGAFGSAAVDVSYKLTDDPGFVRKGDKVRCDVFPYGPDQAAWAKDTTYPYGDGKKKSSDTTVVLNTPPEVTGVKVVPLDASYTINTSYLCELDTWDDKDGAADLSNLRFTYTWHNGSLDYALMPKTPNVAIGTPGLVEAKKFTPAKDAPGSIGAGQVLCCKITVTDTGNLGAPVGDSTSMLSPKEACIKLTNGAPEMVFQPGQNKIAQVIASSVQGSAAEPYPQCLDVSDLAKTPTGSFLSAQSLVCDTKGTGKDPDGDAVFMHYRWFTCGQGEAQQELLSKVDDPRALANSLSKESTVCCGVSACDGQGACSPEIKSAPVFIQNTPPKVGTPTVVVGGLKPTGDKLGTFLCDVELLDCDGDDVAGKSEVLWSTADGTPPAWPATLMTSLDKVSGLGCSEGLRCRVTAKDGSITAEQAKVTAWSQPLQLKNDPPKVGAVSISGGVKPTVASTLTCSFSGLVDPNGDDPASVSVRWLANGALLTETSAAGTGGKAELSLGSCQKALYAVKKGDVMTCEVRACDGCGACSDYVASNTPPSASTVTLQDSPTVVSGAGLVTLTPEVGGKGDTFMCAIDLGKLQDCDGGEPESFEYVFRLVGQGGVVIANEQGVKSKVTQAPFKFDQCPAIDVFWCEVDVRDKADASVLSPAPTSGTVHLDESPPVVAVLLEPAGPKVGDQVTCTTTALTDADPEDVPKLKPTWKWLVNGASRDDLEGLQKITLTEGTFKKNDKVACTATVSDGCFPAVTSGLSAVTIANSPPTLSGATLGPAAPKMTSTLTCTAGTYADKDGDPEWAVVFEWQTNTTGKLDDWKAVPIACQKDVPAERKSLFDLDQCLQMVPAKGHQIRCLARAVDGPLAPPSQSPAATSIAVTIADSPPMLLDVSLAPYGSSLPSAPSLDPGQNVLRCAADANDPDGDAFSVSRMWMIYGSDGAQKGAFAGGEDLDLGTAGVSSCDSVVCEVTLKNAQGLKVTSEVRSADIRGGGSLYFGGVPNAWVDLKPGTVSGVTSTGTLELWYWAEVLPAVGTVRNTLLERVDASVAKQWELAIQPGGSVALRSGSANFFTPSGAGVGTAQLQAGVWTHIALSWDAVSATLWVGGVAVGTWSTALPFDLGATRLGASGGRAPGGYIDELRVRSAKATPQPNQPYLQKTADTLALYHLDPAEGDVVADVTGNGFHGAFGSSPAARRVHAQLDACGLVACGAGTDSCLLPPTSVSLEYAGTTFSGGVLEYVARCKASGGVDLSGGTVTDYKFMWYDQTTGQNIGEAKIGKGEATQKVAVGSGCRYVTCTAAPLPLGGGAEGPSASSAPAKALCVLNGTAVVDFGCDDGNKCTADVADPVTGCAHDVDDGATCSTQCAQLQTSACVGGQCLCLSQCSNPEDDPCIQAVSVAPDGTCIYGPKQNGTPCVPLSACVSGEGQCQSGVCVNAPQLSCDDGNPCTDDWCDEAAGCKHANNAKECSDGSACTVGDVCLNGSCKSGGLLDCNDGNTCTSDACNPGAATPAVACTYVPLTGPTCSDGNACTKNDACSAGSCKGTADNCNDGNPCTNDACDPAKGCVYTFNTSACDDLDACTKSDQCVSGTCQGIAASCNDGNPCTDDSCDKVAGCQYAANTASCSDSNVCTTGDKCSNKVCAGSLVDCDDGNVCTTDWCDGVDGCQHANNAAPCNDGNACTTGDKCSGGTCGGTTTLVCNDDNPCTDDSCKPGSGCSFVPNAKACEDGNACTTGDVCVQGACASGTTLDCNASNTNPCTFAQCSPAVGCLAAAPVANGKPCDDKTKCTSSDACQAGVCKGATVDCNDGNPCTDDSCDAVLGCLYQPNAAPCDDGNTCTVGDYCSGGGCFSGAAKVCNDNNVCTNDSCNPVTGCVHSNNTVPCDDGNACTPTSTCGAGSCVGSGQVDCTDGNPCTGDQCDPGVGCFYINLAIPCTDGSACTKDDQCVDGACKGINPVVCNDDNVCTDDSCNPQTGCVYTANAASCNDGNACTNNDKCANKACGGTTISCNDNNACTVDSCDTATGCKHTPQSGTPCNDNNSCTTVDTCSNGVCVGSVPPNCDDGNACTNDSCDGGAGCVHVNNASACEDGSLCTTGDFCLDGICKSGSVVQCADDGNACTAELCKPEAGCGYVPLTGNPCNDGNPCTQGESCSNGVCGGGSATTCPSDGNPCTIESCDPVTGCKSTNATNGTPCADSNLCTLNDSCQNGVCISGPTKPACCNPQDFGPYPSTCGQAFEGELSSGNAYPSYNATCPDLWGGNDYELCLPTLAPSTAELCVDFPTATGAAMLLYDGAETPAVESCQLAVADGTCTTVPSTNPGHVVVLDSKSAGPQQVRYHVRCPVGAACTPGTTFTCNNAWMCQSTFWTNSVGSQASDYGPSCASAAPGPERMFKFTPATTAVHTVWASPKSPDLKIYIAPSNGGSCNPTDCTTFGVSPRHFSAQAGQEVCIWVELPATGTPATVNLSVSCYGALP